MHTIKDSTDLAGEIDKKGNCHCDGNCMADQFAQMERALRSLGSLNTEPEESTLGKDSSVHLMYSDPKLKERILLCWRISLPSSQNFRFSTLGHRSLIRNGTPTVVININAFLYKLDVLYPSQHTILK